MSLDNPKANQQVKFKHFKLFLIEVEFVLKLGFKEEENDFIGFH